MAENGPLGLFRGVDACMLRVGIGSTIQLPTFHLANEHLHANVPFLKECPGGIRAKLEMEPVRLCQPCFCASCRNVFMSNSS